MMVFAIRQQSQKETMINLIISDHSSSKNGGVIPANISKNDEDSINNTLEDLASKIGLKNGTIK